MRIHPKRLALALASAVTFTLFGCGGGGGSNSSTTDDVDVTVIDGAIGNATVCLDRNNNGACDSGEPTGKTNAAGKVTLKIDKADTGKYPILALVGTDATDADTGPVMAAFSLSAPADKSAVVSPLTTLVHHIMGTSGIGSDDAAKVLTDLTGLTVSVFQDYTQAAAGSGGTDAATLARMLVVTTQQQYTAVQNVVGTQATDGDTITKSKVDLAIRKKLLERMPDMLTALSNPAVKNAANAGAKEAALQSAATTLVADSGLSAMSLPTLVAIDNQISNPVPETVRVPTAGISLATLNFTDTMNYYMRQSTFTVAQDTPDANNDVRYQDRRRKVNNGFAAQWASGSSSTPARQADLHWNGSAWVGCGLNFESTGKVRDAQGNSSYNYCDNRETGTSNRASFDISGRTMLSVYNEAIAAGFTTLTIANASAVLGSATFPTGSAIRYGGGVMTSAAFTYYPAGKDSPTGVSNTVANFSPAITAGGDGRLQPQGQGCNTTTEGNGTKTTTLEQMISSFTGNPCSFGGGSFVYQGVTYTNPDPVNEQWGPQSLSMGSLGTAPVGSGTAPGFYTTNTRFRVAFKGTGANATTYYACKERFDTGSTRNCTAIGTGSYTITTLGDARVMTFNNVPAQRGPLTYNQIYVERGGAVYYGYQSKLVTFQSARPNSVGSIALLTQLGLPVEDPSVPFALTTGSYQGTWDLTPNPADGPNDGITIFINANGSVSCVDRLDNSAFACSVTITNTATGAFTFDTTPPSAFTAQGSFNFLTGALSGTFVDAGQGVENFNGGRR